MADVSLSLSAVRSQIRVSKACFSVDNYHANILRPKSSITILRYYQPPKLYSDMLHLFAKVEARYSAFYAIVAWRYFILTIDVPAHDTICLVVTLTAAMKYFETNCHLSLGEELSFFPDYCLIEPFMRVKECGGNEYSKLSPEASTSDFCMVLTVSLPKSFMALISGPLTS